MTSTRTKIVCTLGPSSQDDTVIRRMIQAGMTVARFNMSHGSHEQHRELLGRLRACAEAEGAHVAALLDLQGPKIRVGRFKADSALLLPGAKFTITTRPVEGNSQIVSTTYASLASDAQVGDKVLLDDGLLELRVVSRSDTDLDCEVLIGGELRNNKGINLPGATLSVSTLTPKDREDIDFAVSQDVDYIAMSFVRHPDDMTRLRKILREKGSDVPILAKIEKPEALNHLDAIIHASDAIMVARGDLGVEMPPEEVPAIQKRLIARSNEAGVPVITATQMLDSMVNNPRPTRAEASDVANAILDGTDAVMLSAESASGKYPVESVEVMRRIIVATEQNPKGPPPWRTHVNGEGFHLPSNEGIAAAACTLADQVGASAIVSITMSGSMARAIARNRPSRPVYAISQRLAALRQLALVWGTEGIYMDDLTDSIDDVVRQVEAMMLELGKLKRGDRFVLTAGLPFSDRQATNMVRVDTVR
jgi:pyruvate kinase